MSQSTTVDYKIDKEINEFSSKKGQTYIAFFHYSTVENESNSMNKV